MNILTGRCDEKPMFGQCPYCHASLTNGHTCPALEAQVAQALAKGDDEKPPKLAKMIRLWSAAEGAEQIAIAEAIKCSPSTLSRFINGQTVPDGRTMVRIMEWLMAP